jgi:hypothetical protein
MVHRSAYVFVMSTRECLDATVKAPSADMDKDKDVDGFDFLTFSNCYNGSNKKPQAVCFPPNLTNCLP